MIRFGPFFFLFNLAKKNFRPFPPNEQLHNKHTHTHKKKTNNGFILVFFLPASLPSSPSFHS